MALLVVAYPQLTPPDVAWIQAIRQQHDPHYALIEPHFTLVFPVTTVSQAEVIAHVAAQTTQRSAIAFTIRCAMIVKDVFSPLIHIFLVPDEGYSALVKLHDALYTRTLAHSLRIDVPFIPHITIGAYEDPQVCKSIADDINHQDIHLQGWISALDIISYEHPIVATETRILLNDHREG